MTDSLRKFHHTKASLRTSIQIEIMSFENRIIELRLERIPDVETIRSLEAGLKKLNDKLAKHNAEDDEVFVAPV